MVGFVLLTLVPMFLSISVRNVRVEEEKVRGDCSGFVWELLFEVDGRWSSYGSNPSFYALYWPNPSSKKSPSAESLDPYSAYSCLTSGGVQKLKSKAISVDLGITNFGFISLFRLRSMVEYFVQLHDNSTHEALSSILAFFPKHSPHCEPLRPKRNTSYGYFTSPLIRFDRFPNLYWIDQTGAVVHCLNSINQIGIDADQYNKVATHVHAYYLSPFGDKRFIIFFQNYHRKSYGQYYIFDSKGMLRYARQLECVPGFHHEAIYDSELHAIYTLSFGGFRGKMNLSLNSTCGNFAFDSCQIVRYDISSDEFDAVFSLTATYNHLNSSAEDLVDFSRDFETQYFGSILDCQKYNDSCGNEWGLDVAHPNSFKRAQDGSGRFVLSLRHTSQIILLDRRFVARQVVGGNGRNKGTYKFKTQDDRFRAQHSPIIDADGTLLLLDNGMDSFTRAMRLRLDNITMEAHSIWEFNLTRFSGQVALCCGSVSVNKAGNVITHDANPYNHSTFNIYEVDALKKDTPIAIVTLQKYVPPSKKDEQVDYFHNRNTIYRTAEDTDIDGEHVICDTRTHPVEIKPLSVTVEKKVPKATPDFLHPAFRNYLFQLYLMLVGMVFLWMCYFRRVLQFYHWKYFVVVVLTINFLLAVVSITK